MPHKGKSGRAYKASPGHPASKGSQSRVGAKISHLAKEGVPAKQRIATALDMERSRKLGPRGGYKRKA